MRVEPPKEAAPGSLAYDIDEATRFDVQHGPDQITYDELCDMQAGRTDLRVSSSFIDGGSNRSKCWVFWSPRHDCVAVYDHGTLVTHYPSNMATLIDDDGSMNGLWEQLRKLRDDGGGSGKAATAAELPQEDEADAQGGAPPRDAAAADGGNWGVTIDDFYAYMPSHCTSSCRPARCGRRASVNARLPKVPVKKKDGTRRGRGRQAAKHVKPSVWLDRHRPVEQMTWAPGEPLTIDGQADRRGRLVRAAGDDDVQPVSPAAACGRATLPTRSAGSNWCSGSTLTMPTHIIALLRAPHPAAGRQDQPRAHTRRRSRHRQGHPARAAQARRRPWNFTRGLAAGHHGQLQRLSCAAWCCASRRRTTSATSTATRSTTT